MYVRAALFIGVLLASILVAVQLIEKSSASASCSDNWNQWKNSCYKFFPTQAPWQTASSNCTAEGATLVTILSLEENIFVNSLMRGQFVIWIDLRREAQASAYVWHSGNPVGFQNWKTGEPNGRADLPEDCVHMNRNGSWERSSCRNWVSYICKIAPPAQDGHENKEESYFSRLDWALVSHVFSAKVASSELECAWFCLNEVHCKSFNYKLVKRLCELNAATEVQFPMHFIQQKGSMYSSPRN